MRIVVLLSLKRIFGFGERRKEQRPVTNERRRDRRTRMQRSEESLLETTRVFDSAVRGKRDTLLRREAANGQNQVQFDTMQAVCPDAVRAGEHRLCRHPRHEAANTGIAVCDERLCPLLRA